MRVDVERQAEWEMLKAAAASCRPRAMVDRSKWCADNLYLPAETSATPGPYDLERYAYLKEPLDAVADPDVEQIVLCWATQLGKTTLLQAILASQAMLAPVPAMLGSADKDSLVELRDKFYALAEASPAVAPTLPDLRLRNNRWIDVGGTRCHLAYSYNTQRMSGKSCALVLCTELDRWRKTLTHGDPFKIISQRVKAFHRFKIVAESTPSNEASRIYRLYEQSDQRRFLVPCPECQRWQELRFFPYRKGDRKGRGGVAGLHDEKGNLRSADEVVEAAYYVCENGCRIENAQKPAMVRQGRWIPRGQRVTSDGELVGQAVKSKRIWGARLSSLYAETVSFGRCAAEWINSRDKLDELQVFYNDWLALRWKKKTKTLAWQELGRRLKGNYQPGVVPPWAMFLTAGIDVQKRYCRYVVRAWGEGGKSALVQWGSTRRTQEEPADDAPESERALWAARLRLSHLHGLSEEVLLRRWHLPAGEVNPVGHRSLVVALAGIDVGYQPHLVHEYWLSLGSARSRVRMVRGIAEIKGGERYVRRVVERSARDGKPYEGGQVQWAINRAFFNDDLHSRWRLPTDSPAAWLLTAAETHLCEQYLRELVNEAPVMTRNKYGRMVPVWQVVDESQGNHYFDCEAYAAALADMVVGGDWRNLANLAMKPKPPAARVESPYAARDDRGDYSARE